jgi:hypothetical protein
VGCGWQLPDLERQLTSGFDPFSVGKLSKLNQSLFDLLAEATTQQQQR